MSVGREVFSEEMETRDDHEGSLVREVMLTIKTADTLGAGTNAKVFFQIGAKTFLLDDSIGRAAQIDPKTKALHVPASALPSGPKETMPEPPSKKVTIRSGFSLNLGVIDFSRKTTTVDGETKTSFGLSVGGVPISADMLPGSFEAPSGPLQPIELPEGQVERVLERIRIDEFERGQTDVFFIKDLGELTLAQLRSASIQLFHDTRGATSDWHIWQIDLMVSYDKSYQFYKKWHAVGWLKDSAPLIVLQSAVGGAVS